ncbi:hypothetical protein [Mesobacillus zeae]|uniref:hypothetical protein n=1 Tax=Mesobacillus zeae TaxID=1917180 RepID=UPI0015E67C8C|nr:hypothetical protein [Mesobacillus zeae]
MSILINHHSGGAGRLLFCDIDQLLRDIDQIGGVIYQPASDIDQPVPNINQISGYINQLQLQPSFQRIVPNPLPHSITIFKLAKEA